MNFHHLAPIVAGVVVNKFSLKGEGKCARVCVGGEEGGR